MDALAARLAEDYPEYNRGRGITVFASKDVRMHPQGDGKLLLAGGLLSAVVLTILLLACANLANLLLVRGLGRSGEMAVRSALGAPRGRVARLFLLESLLLVRGGRPAGPPSDALGAGGDPRPSARRGIPGDMPHLGIDARVALFSVVLMALTGVLFGLRPRPSAPPARRGPGPAGRPSGRVGRPGRVALRSLLVAVQVAASLVLVLGTGLLARSLAALAVAGPGVDADHVAYLRVDWSRAGLEGGQVQAALDELRERLEALPGRHRGGAGLAAPGAECRDHHHGGGGLHARRRVRTRWSCPSPW